VSPIVQKLTRMWRYTGQWS